MVIPAKQTCSTSWTKEYYVYLMTECKDHSSAALECMDSDPEAVPDSEGNTNGGLLYHVELACSGLFCPPCDVEKKLTCVVCTK